MGQVGRRHFLIATGALLGAPVIGRAQAPKTLPVLGILNLGPQPTPEQIERSPATKHLREMGWIDGSTMRIERANAEGKFDRLPELAKALVEKKVNVIWTASPLGAVAAARATKTIPVVFWRVGFPVEFGLVDSLAKPGRNVTGLAWFADETIYLKRYQLLREMLPKAERVANVTTTAGEWQTVSGEPLKTGLREKIDAGVRKLGFDLLRAEIAVASDFARVAADVEKWGAHSLSVSDHPSTVFARAQIIEFARRNRLPAVYEAQEWTRAGGLFSYGIVFLPTLLRSFEMVDRILRGANPAEIPVELPRDYEFTVNLKTAKELGLTIPQSVLLRADRVIE